MKYCDELLQSDKRGPIASSRTIQNSEKAWIHTCQLFIRRENSLNYSSGDITEANQRIV